MSGYKKALILALLLFAGPDLTLAAIEPPILRVSMENEPITLNWSNARTSTDRFIISFLMRGLLKYDGEARLVCDLCTSFTTSPDRKSLVFELSDEIWSDGAKLEAEQFVDSFRRLLDPANRFRVHEDFRVIEGAVQSAKKWDPKKLGVRAENNRKLEIQLSRPLSLFPHLLTTVAAFPIRKEFLHDAPPAGQKKSRRDTGEEHATEAVLGPYQLAAWERGKRIVIEGNPKFTGSRPVYRVEFILGKHAEQINRFKAGKLDIVSNPTTEDLLKVPGQKLQVNPYWATRNLITNAGRQPGSDLSFRRALLYALDRDTLPAYLRSGERRATGVIPPGLLGYRELPLVTTDLARAQAERNRAVPARPVTLELLVLDTEVDRKVAQWISDQLQKIQVRIKVIAKPSSGYYSELESGKFDLALVTWAFGIATPLDLLRTFRTDAAENRGKWTHVAFDALLGQLLQEEKPAEAAALVDQTCQTLEVAGVGAIPLGYPTQPFLLGRRVNNFATTPFGDPDLVKIQLKQ
ncbi:MAG TPA: ABC transporter substrate-binding protein [Bdellovibrionota bacterium]|nr:ABC transporter substrate-binding protein [Bdellovibrionota bacterium]